MKERRQKNLPRQGQAIHTSKTEHYKITKENTTQSLLEKAQRQISNVMPKKRKKFGIKCRKGQNMREILNG